MYLEHFGLTEYPFSTVPNPRFYYPSIKHKEALSCLIYAVEQKKGFALITGAPYQPDIFVPDMKGLADAMC